MKTRWLIPLFLCGIAHAVVTNQNVSVTYTCSGSTGPFSFTFPISTATGITVTQNGSVLATSAYTVAPVNNNYTNGGNVTLNASCPSPQTLVIERTTPLTQTSVFTDNMPVPMATIGNSLDKLTMIDQEQTALISAAGTGCGIISTCTIPLGGTGATTAAGALENLSTPIQIACSPSLSGSTMDAKIASAYAALPNGGTIDARCFGAGVQAWASTGASALLMGDGVHAWTFLCDPATDIQPTGTTGPMFIHGSGLKVDGCHFDASNQSTWSGALVQYGQAGHESDPCYVQGPFTYGQFPGREPNGCSVPGFSPWAPFPLTILSNVKIDTGVSTAARGIDMLASGRTSYMESILIDNTTVSTPGVGVYMYTSDTGVGWIQNNTLNNVTINFQPIGSCTATQSGTTVTFSGCTSGQVNNGNGIYGLGWTAETLSSVSTPGTYPQTATGSASQTVSSGTLATITYATVGILLNPGYDSGAGGGIDSNKFPGLTIKGAGFAGTDGILGEGNGYFRNNNFSTSNLWDLSLGLAAIDYSTSTRFEYNAFTGSIHSGANVLVNASCVNFCGNTFPIQTSNQTMTVDNAGNVYLPANATMNAPKGSFPTSLATGPVTETGTSTNSFTSSLTTAVMSVNFTGSTSSGLLFNMLCPNLGNTYFCGNYLGQAQSNFESISDRFYQIGAGSNTNYEGKNFYGQNITYTEFGTGHFFLGSSAADNGYTLEVNGSTKVDSSITAASFQPQSGASGGPWVSTGDEFFTSAMITGGSIGSVSGNSCSSSATVEDINHPGNIKLTSGTGGNGTGETCFVGASMQLLSLNASPAWTYETAVYPGVLPLTTAGAFQAGLVQTVAASPWTTGIGFLLSSASSVGAAGAFGTGNAPTSYNDWVCQYSGNYADSGVLATVGWHRLTLVQDATNIHWLIDGTEECGTGVAIANLSSSLMQPAFTSVAGSGTSVLFYSDYWTFTRKVTR